MTDKNEILTGHYDIDHETMEPDTDYDEIVMSMENQLRADSLSDSQLAYFSEKFREPKKTAECEAFVSAFACYVWSEVEDERDETGSRFGTVFIQPPPDRWPEKLKRYYSSYALENGALVLYKKILWASP